jgi:SP family galactose:H+ symporter-like MFS transporter
MATEESSSRYENRSPDIPEEGLHKTGRWGLFINLATFLIGYSTAVISGALLYIEGDLELDEAERAEGTGAGSSVNWLSNFAVSTAFLPLVEAIGTGEVFLVFAVVCAFALWFVNRYVPETKERNFSEIDADLQVPWAGANGVASSEST